MSDAASLVLDAIVRTYVQAEERLEVLRGATLGVAPGEIVALVGPSGSGKSTLLHVAGLLEHPDNGDVMIGGQSCGAMNDNEASQRPSMVNPRSTRL